MIARNRCDWLILGFDSDELIQSRKGTERINRGEPAERFNIKQRRSFAAGLPGTDITVQLRPNEINEEALLHDYKELGIDIIFIGEEDHPATPRMQRSMDKLGGEVMVLSMVGGSVHSTDIMEHLRKYKLFNTILKET